jgi:CheY-like chemotaxis protein
MSLTGESKLRVLVVDDEPNVCYCLKLMLASEGHDAVAVNSAGAALDLFDQEKFDLVFTDYAMPGMKGDQLATAIKARSPGQPVLMITGFAPASAAPSVDMVLHKPFLLQEIREAIDRLLPGLQR